MATDSGSSDQVMETYKASYDACYALYDKDKFAECIDQLENLLIDSGLPRFFRIKLLILMAACMGDWWEEREVLEEADKVWRHVRSYHRQGDTEVDDCLAKLRHGIDHAQKQHRDAGCPKSSSAVPGGADSDGEDGSGDEESLEAGDETLLATTDPMPGTDFAMGGNVTGDDVPDVVEVPPSATDVADAQSPSHAPSSAPTPAVDTNRLSVLPLRGPKSTHSFHHISRMIGRCSWLSDQRLHDDEVDKDHFMYPWILFTGGKMGIATVKQQFVSDMNEIVGEWDVEGKVYEIGSDGERGSLVSRNV
ncbi:hypothetical protein LTS02_008076 [Friedmanniomyces endolithicus]|nr:hypothetical protein LTR38_016636 [Friedmanniomyces endolithicus]KAK0779344.1 hypothetical protein LTR75_015380 [Friedmanniomyces endolithicus]KAK0827983.1 hypothetical protein LTR03_016703 [Friedmanniomyces endolithicus]KAK0861085.1 hypothetical protein LTS02_008076 [Friedmanniomyces endolithicus]KAK0956759.1 hypothetical protein LTS01_022683 [Friedmanniomyces endolithicus]